MPESVILIGVGGYGAHHLVIIRQLQTTGHVQLIGLVDPFLKAKLLADPDLGAPLDAPLFDDLAAAVAEVGKADIVVIATPIHTHAPLAKAALLAGSDVLLEKPPFARLDDYNEVLALEATTGRKVQVGFQSLGSVALSSFASGDIDVGEIKSVRALGNWLRAESYWKRSPWVGRRSMGDAEMVDGVTTNSLAHAIMTALHIAEIKAADDVGQVELELYRANPIDADDTASIRISPTSSNRPKVIAAITLCAAEQTLARVEVVGSKNTATFYYTADEVEHNGETQPFGRVNLLENLVQHRQSGAALLSPLRNTGSFMRVVEAVRTHPEPTHIARKWIKLQGSGTEQHPVVQDVEKWLRVAADADALFSEVGVPWSFTGRDRKLAEGSLAGRVIFEIVDGAATIPTSSPRPYIHPLRSLVGVRLTATRPADHDWHCGIGFVVPDVDGTSLWGGGTYVREEARYIDLDNHGKIVSESIEHVSDTRLDQSLAWININGETIVREARCLEWSTLDAASHVGYRLRFDFRLTSLDGDVSLGSPGTNGRKDGGYGGFFWRLPRCSDNLIVSTDLEGEEALHGRVTEWIGWSGNFEGLPGSNGPATLVLVSEPNAAQDPWVVRCQGYPGIGSAVAWEERTIIPAGESINRSFHIAVVDGRLDREEMASVAEALREGIREIL